MNGAYEPKRRARLLPDPAIRQLTPLRDRPFHRESREVQCSCAGCQGLFGYAHYDQDASSWQIGLPPGWVYREERGAWALSRYAETKVRVGYRPKHRAGNPSLIGVPVQQATFVRLPIVAACPRCNTLQRIAPPDDCRHPC